MLMRLTIAAVAIVVCFCTPRVHAAVVTVNAMDNATVLPAGPVAGDIGKSFFTVDGNNDAFASFGVIDFDFTPTGAPNFSSVQQLRVSLTQTQDTFDVSGSLIFYLSQDMTTSIQPAGPLVFNTGGGVGMQSEGLGTQLQPLVSLGSQTFTSSRGATHSFDFALAGAEATYVQNQFNNSKTFRLVVTPGDINVTAPLAGFSNTSLGRPGLSITGEAVPEPSGVAILALATVGLAGARRRFVR